MAEADRQLYPQATPLGEPIPTEFLRPLGLIKQAFTTVAVNDIAIPAAADYLYIEATTDCYVRFDDDITAPANGDHTVGLTVILASNGKLIDHGTAVTFSVIRAGDADGIVYVQTCTRYADIRKLSQAARA